MYVADFWRNIKTIGVFELSMQSLTDYNFMNGLKDVPGIVGDDAHGLSVHTLGPLTILISLRFVFYKT